MDSKDSTPKTIYRVKVAVKYIDPPIWRRFLIPADSNLYLLHMTIQGVMGWENYHMYEFEIAGADMENQCPNSIGLAMN